MTIFSMCRPLRLSWLSLGGLFFLTSAITAQQVGGEFESHRQFHGVFSGSVFGDAVSGAGDVNNDGTDDILIGATLSSANGSYKSGSAYVYSGTTGQQLYRFDGSTAYDQLGNAVAGVGDLNADGYADILIGSANASPNSLSFAGSAFVFSGATGNLLFQMNGADAGDNFGNSVAGAGDVNADGTPDFVVGAFHTSPNGRYRGGSAYLYSGATGLLLHSFHGTSARDYLGGSVAAAGDVNGDGYADVIVGAFGADPNGFLSAGSAFVYSGATGSLLKSFHGAAAQDNFGYSVSGAGDLNADGFADVIIGASGADPNGFLLAGSVFVFSGASGALLFQFDGAAAFDNFGSSVASAGDVNGDGFTDIIIGAHGADPGGRSSAGSAYIYSGESGMLLFQMDGVAQDDGFGNSVAGAGHSGQTNFSDVVVGAAFADPNGQAEAGSAFLFGFNPFLQSSVSSISASVGSLIGLQLDFPTAAASAEYKVLISASGTGIISYGVEIPLALDSLVLQTFSGNYPFAVSTGMQGNLNTLGDAAASISIPPGAYSRFVGRTVHLAAIANQPGYLPSHSSIAVAIAVAP